MQAADTLMRVLERILRPARVPAADETWHRIEGQLAPRRRPRFLPMLVPYAAVLLLALAVAVAWPDRPAESTPAAGIGIPVPGMAPTDTPPARAAVTPALRPTAPATIPFPSPEPTFQILAPRYLPPGMRLIYYLYEPGPGASMPPSPVMPPVADPQTDPAIFEAAAQRAQELRGGGREAALILIYAAGPDQFIEIVQRSDKSCQCQVNNGVATLPGEPAIARNSRAAAFTQRDGRDVLSWLDIASPPNRTSYIEVLSTFGRDEAKRVADGLQEIPRPSLAPQATPSGTPQASAPPYAEWPKIVISPQATTEEATQECGAWQVTNPATPGAQRPNEQMVCFAKLFADFTSPGHGYGVGVRPGSWQDIAAEFGIDQTLGPAGETAVILVTLNITPQGGTMVILDAATGAAHLVLRLQPPP